MEKISAVSPQTRLKQLLVIAGLTLGVVLVTLLFHSDWLNVAIILVSLCLLALGYQFTRRGQTAHGVMTLAAVMGGGAIVLMQAAQGLRNTGAVLGVMFPLVYVAMLGRGQVYWRTAAVMAVALALVALSDILGWVPHTARPITWFTLAITEAVFLGLALALGLLVGDLRKALSVAQAEAQAARESEAAIKRHAFIEPLTGLPNRAALRRSFEAWAEQAAAPGAGPKAMAMFSVNLDNFRTVNESLGYAAGDELLRHVGQGLVRVAAASGLSPAHTGRVGGDEFMLLVAGDPADPRMDRLAQAIVHQVTHPIVLEGASAAVTCSVGLAWYPADGPDFRALVRGANAAMHHAKDIGRNTFCRYHPRMDANVAEHLHLLTGLREALEGQQFQLHYQPQFDLLSGQIVGCEALIRWKHPELGEVPPNKFIPLAESSGFIVPLGAWILQEACRQMGRWDAQGLPPLKVAVNLSWVQFKRDDIERVILDALHASQLKPERIELELTESLMAHDNPQVESLLARLRALGVSFSIDDFGTGYSNLGYLRRMALDQLKIDRSFIHNITHDADSEAIVSAVIQVAKSLRMHVIAEGVENEATRTKLLALGCDAGQGWHWSRALPPDVFADFVRQHATKPCATAPLQRST